MDNKPKCLIVNADELNRLIRENIALKKELRLTTVPCDWCIVVKEYEDSCIGVCEDCTLDCRCRNCDKKDSNFEWRGIVPETEPTPEEEAELRNRLTARGRGHTHD